MNLGEAKKKALSLMAEYSVDGTAIPDGENADYLNRMNRFANDAQMEISNKVGIEATYTFSQISSNVGGYNKYPLPVDFRELLYMNRQDERYTDYRIENSKILVPTTYSGEFELFYYKNPTELTLETPDSYEFEILKHAHSLIPYFVGGMAIQDENPTLADRLLNLYFSKLESLNPVPVNYQSKIQDVYGW